MTEIRIGFQRPFRIGILTGILGIAVTFLLELALLRQLSVFNTGIGLWVLLTQFLGAAAFLLILVFVGSYAFANLSRRGITWKVWIVYYVILGLACFAAFTIGIGNGLGLDVKFSTYVGKAGIDYLKLQYLNGTTIWTALILTLVFMLSDPRISRHTGPDGQKRLYMHSKLLGLLRLFARTNLGEVMRSRRSFYDRPEPRPTFN